MCGYCVDTAWVVDGYRLVPYHDPMPKKRLHVLRPGVGLVCRFRDRLHRDVPPAWRCPRCGRDLRTTTATPDGDAVILRRPLLPRTAQRRPVKPLPES